MPSSTAASRLRRNARRAPYSKYNSIDDRIDDFHYYTTFIEVRHRPAPATTPRRRSAPGDITREEGVALASRFDHEFPSASPRRSSLTSAFLEKEFPIASQMFEQPVMDRAYFENLADSFRSPHLWQYD